MRNAAFILAAVLVTAPLSAWADDTESEEVEAEEVEIGSATTETPPPAAATEAAAETPDPAPNVLGIGLKIGVALPQLTSALETNFDLALELTYLLPVWDSRLGLHSAVGYSRPTASGSGEDPRLPGGEYSYELTQDQFVWDLGLTLRVMPWASDWNVALLVGSRMTFVSTRTDGEAGGEAFGEHDEQGPLYGAFGAVLAEYRLWLGSLFAAVDYGVKLQDLRTTGDLAVSELTIFAGYRFDLAL